MTQKVRLDSYLYLWGFWLIQIRRAIYDIYFYNDNQDGLAKKAQKKTFKK